MSVEERIDTKISEAQKILMDLGMQPQYQNKICALSLLALCNLKPFNKWKSASKKSMIISKDIMEFVIDNYKIDYAANSRESFRKSALRPFTEYNIAVLNPDNPELSLTSPNTHYAISDLALETIKNFDTNNWEAAVRNFREKQFPENSISENLLTKIHVSNYKSILDDVIELGRFNVFIGENGCGKSNILESIAFIGAAKANDLNFDGLYSRGIRIARPDLILSSFLNNVQSDDIVIELEFKEREEVRIINSRLYPENKQDVYSKWISGFKNEHTKDLINDLQQIINKLNIDSSVKVADILDQLEGRNYKFDGEELKKLTEYGIYDLNTKSLRGITPSDSRKTPLGLNGEGIDLLISSFNPLERDYLKKCELFFKWFEELISEKDGKHKLSGLKPGRSTSSLYFMDKYMLKKNNILSAENSNEGILHVLFYLALFISNKTPQLFAIDNIETALNPRLCQRLIVELSELSKNRGKQVLITTHNPAILDGLNLLDDNIRLFEVYRTSEGHTQTRRIKFRSDLSDKKFKLSEMWLKGLLGAVPDNF